MIFGERILDYGELSVYRFKELRDKLGLPHVGERVRSKVSKKLVIIQAKIRPCRIITRRKTLLFRNTGKFFMIGNRRRLGW